MSVIFSQPLQSSFDSCMPAVYCVQKYRNEASLLNVVLLSSQMTEACVFINFLRFDMTQNVSNQQPRATLQKTSRDVQTPNERQAECAASCVSALENTW